jgi:hypothetical protein
MISRPPSSGGTKNNRKWQIGAPITTEEQAGSREEVEHGQRCRGEERGEGSRAEKEEADQAGH